MDIRIKRIYDAVDVEDGYRVLVDRIWPRGMTKGRAKVDLWLKEIAPGTALRKWFNHDPANWETFKSRYFLELDEKPDDVATLLEQAKKGSVTLLFSARNPEYNQAAALKQYLMNQSERKPLEKEHL